MMRCAAAAAAECRWVGELSKDILSGRVTKDAVVEAVLEDGVVKFENVEMPAV